MYFSTPRGLRSLAPAQQPAQKVPPFTRVKSVCLHLHCSAGSRPVAQPPSPEGTRAVRELATATKASKSTHLARPCPSHPPQAVSRVISQSAPLKQSVGQTEGQSPQQATCLDTAIPSPCISRKEGCARHLSQIPIAKSSPHFTVMQRIFCDRPQTTEHPNAEFAPIPAWIRELQEQSPPPRQSV